MPTSAIACPLLTHGGSAVVASAPAVVASAPAVVDSAPVESGIGARDIDGVSAANGSCDGRSTGTCFASAPVDALGDKTDPVFLDEAFIAAFGAPLLNYGGGADLPERRLWWEIVGLRGQQYALPGGCAGRRFVDILAGEIESCTAGRQGSEREFILTSLILQRDKMVKKAKDIRPLLARRMAIWESGQSYQNTLHH